MRNKKYFSLVILLILLGCDNPFSSKHEEETFSVQYKITGTARKVDITYENETGGTSQLSDVPTPWSYSFKGKPGYFVYISAQNQDSTGTVTATILKNGVTFKTSSSSGAYVIATASGSL